MMSIFGPNNYDRDLTDVFAIQTDLAQRDRKRAIQAKLSRSTEKALMERKPTENGEAYLAFVQAHDLPERPLRTSGNSNKASSFMPRAHRARPEICPRSCALLTVGKLDLSPSFDPRLGNGAKKPRALAEQAPAIAA